MIRVTHVSMRGFGAYKDVVGIDLRPGRHVILGRNKDTDAAGSNGAGKTTIFKALSWALYGETIDKLSEPDVLHVDVKKAVVKVWFESSGKFFKVTRERTPKTGKLELEEFTLPPGSELVASLTQTKKQATQDAIVRLLGMDWDAFRCTVLFGQGDHSRFASPTMTDAARKAVLSTVLRLDAYNEARAKAVEIRGECDRVIASTNLEISAFDARADEQRRLVIRAEGAKGSASEALEDGEEIAKEHDSSVRLKEAEAAEQRTELAPFEEELEELNRDLEEAHALKSKTAGLKSRESVALPTARREAAALATEGDCSACGQPRPYDPVKHREALAAVRDLEEKASRANELDREAAREVREVEEEVKRIERLITLKKRKIVTIEREIERHEASKEATEKAVERARDKIAEADEVIRAAKSRIEAIGIEKGPLLGKLRDAERRRRVADWWSKGLGPKGVPAYAIEQSLPVLNEKTNRHLTELADGDIEVIWTATTTGTSGAEKEQLTQTLLIEGVPGAAPSGGQSKKIELATELALAELMQERENIGANILLLDEALDGLDVEGQDRVIEWVHRCLPHEAVFVVSHDESISDSFDSRLIVTKRDRVSSVKWEG